MTTLVLIIIKNDNDTVINTVTIYREFVFPFPPLFLDKRMAPRDQHPCLPLQTTEEAVTDIYQVCASSKAHIVNVYKLL